jgi:hypothetical protein
MFIKKRTAWPKNLETLNTEPTDDNLKKYSHVTGTLSKHVNLLIKAIITQLIKSIAFKLPYTEPSKRPLVPSEM